MRRFVLLIALINAPVVRAQQIVTVVTHDFAFQMPDTLHEMVLVKIGDHDSLGVALESAGLFGGPAAEFPGTDQSNMTVDLEPGRYAVVCGVPSVDARRT